MKKKILSILLSFAMVITMMPMMTFTAFADEANAQAVVMLKAKTSGKTAVKLSWTKVDNATKYVVYGNKCGSDVKKLITVKTNSYTVKKIKNTKLKANKTYRFYVVAYNGETTVGKSKTIHFITGNTSGKYANASKITATAAELNLEVGTSGQVGAEVEIYNNKNHLPSSHGAATEYVSKNPAVATVSSKGKVTAVSEGTTTIYIQDIGGLYCKTTVNVTDNRDRDAVESYKQEIIAKCESLSKLTDTKGIKTMIADAKAGIGALAYNKALTLEENKAAVDAVYTGLVEKVKQQRIKQGLKLGALTAIIGIAGVTGIIIHKIKQTPEPPTPPTPTTYTVTFDLNGIEGTAPEAQKIEENSKVKKPTDPTDTIHTFAGWYKTKDATTGELSDPWNFDTDTVTADMTLYAKWTRTLGSIYSNSDIPKADNNSAPDDAWVNGDGGKAFIAYSGKTSEVLYLYKKLEPSGAKQLSCYKSTNFTKIGDDYVLDYYINNKFYGKYTLHMTNGKLTSVTYNGAGTDYEVLSGTYTAPALSIGGKVFYSALGTDDAKAKYKFYKADGSEITDWSVDGDGMVTGLGDAVSYKSAAPAGAQNFYVMGTDGSGNPLTVSGEWGGYATSTNVTTDTIGSGKANTDTLINLSLSGDHEQTIWEKINDLRSTAGGYNDWFIGSNVEQENLKNSGIAGTWYSSKCVWTSVEYDSYHGCSYEDGGLDEDYKSGQNIAVALRAF